MGFMAAAGGAGGAGAAGGAAGGGAGAASFGSMFSGGGGGGGASSKGTVAVLRDLFGTQQIVPTGSSTSARLDIGSLQRADLERQRAGLQTNATRFQNQLNDLRLGALQGIPTGGPTRFQGFTPTTFSTAPDALTQAIAAQGQQALAQQASTQQQAIARQFASQPGVGQALQRQAAIQAQLQGNPLILQAQQDQANRQLQQEQLRLQGTALTNQAVQAQQAAGSAGRAEAFGYGGAAVQNRQNLLNAATQLAQLLGTQRQETQQEYRTQASGGLLKK